MRIRIGSLLLTLVILVLAGSCAGNRGNHYPLDEAYTLYDDLGPRLTSLMRSYPQTCRVHLIGFSGTEELPIYALQIGDRKLTRKALIIGQHHGDEVLGIEVALTIAKDLLSSEDKINREILKHYQIWIIPTINPEGWRVVRSGEYQWKRRNNRDTNRNGIFEVREDGVDLNRNYPLYWEFDQLTAVSDQYYKGSAPASEAEVRAVTELADKEKFSIAIFYHSSASGAFNEKLYLPWQDPELSEDLARWDKLVKLAEFYAGQVKKDYLKGTYEVHKTGNSRMGNARNYFFHSQKCPAFLVEIGGKNSSGVSVVHPGADMVSRITRKHLNAFRKTMLYLASEQKE